MRGPVRKAIRNETALLLVIAALFSAAAIPVMDGLLEPSQPPAVAAVEIGQPGDGARTGLAREGRRRTAGDGRSRGGEQRAQRSSRRRPAGDAGVLSEEASSGRPAQPSQRRARPAPERRSQRSGGRRSRPSDPAPAAPAPPGPAPSVPPPDDDGSQDEAGDDAD
jgi:hypothetical protein